MNKTLALSLTLFTLLAASCDDYDSFTDSSDARLRFSSDTVSFDTLFAGVPSVSRTLIVWNTADKGVRLSSVRLEQGSASPFRVNVDGETLDGELRDIEIRKGDSLFVFAETTLTQSASDALLFTLSGGQTQRVPLVGAAIDAELYADGLVIDRDTTLSADTRRVIYHSLIVEEGATLTLPAGTTLYFHTAATLDIRGSLIANGTLEEPVTLRGDRLDNLFDYLPYDNTTNRWGGVSIHSTSPGNALTYVDIHSSDWGLKVDTSSVAINGCIFHNIGGVGLRLLSSTALVANSQFSNTLGDCVAVYGGAADFTFCTMAQFYPWDAGRGSALYIADRLLDIDAPFSYLRFSSCLITGYADDTLMGSVENEDSAPFLFSHCSLRTPTDESGHYADVVWELAKNDGKDDKRLQGSKQFALFDTDNFLYDFRPLPESIAVGCADPSDAALYPLDRLGQQRTDSITCGCYQPKR